MKRILALSCMIALAGCSSDDDGDGAGPDVDTGDTGAMVAADPDAVFVTPDRVTFQDTPFEGVALAQAFSDPMDGSHETFVRVAAGGAIPPHFHTEGTYSIVVDGPMEIPVPIDEMNPMQMVTGSAGFAPAGTEHVMACLRPEAMEEPCVFLIHQDGAFDVTPTGNMLIEAGTGTSARNPDATEVPFDDADGWVDVGIPGVDFRAVVGNFGVQDASQHGTLVRVQGGMGIPPHFHSLEARGFVLVGDVEVPVPFDQTNPTTLQPGGYFSVPAMTAHEMNCASETTCIFYLRQDGDFDFTPVTDTTAGEAGSGNPPATNPPATTARLVSNISELDGSETLVDSETGLTWVNDIQFCMAGVTRAEDATCNVLNDMAVSGLTDWRLPNSAEMSEITLVVDADEDTTLNYINASCAVMTASDGWVFTENSTAPGVLSSIEPGNAGVRCVSGARDI